MAQVNSGPDAPAGDIAEARTVGQSNRSGDAVLADMGSSGS
jgi:hypothetical protein